ncbi:hypothetical protein PHLGIDRAFT_197572 [Phlebiopsis gigantea 11061_1 CR5-6]|uniref:Uncharacterized protein n=1 Tax=Phlebiopsis gigantea (strain 11061_1 CR5-6) TaxID=745531 RepID=A0A0C3S4R1_PHLG1|nr:hypothetical protein PHLGIDRAFT_197572 [Phlebiopsis gigantea 11061_1 CR5-6]
MAAVSESEPPVFPTRFRQPFGDPLQALCTSYHVGQPLTQLVAGAYIPDTIDMEVIYIAHMPTHALVILNASDTAPADSTPIVAPIDIFAFNKVFNTDILRLPERTFTPTPDCRTCVPHLDSVRNMYAVSLPTIVVHASDPASVPLLLLFALWNHLPAPPPLDPSRPPSPVISSIEIAEALPRSVPSTPPPTPTSSISQPSIAIPPPPTPVVCTGLLATYLLPIQVIEEFPSAPAMAEAMARTCSPREVDACAAHSSKLWQNVLAFAPRDEAILQIVQVAWEVSREASKMLERHYEARRAMRRAARTRQAQPSTPTTPTAAAPVPQATS